MPGMRLRGQPGPVLSPHFALKCGNAFQFGAGCDGSEGKAGGRFHITGQSGRVAEDECLGGLRSGSVLRQQGSEVAAVVVEGLPLEGSVVVVVEGERLGDQRL